ncbi:MAG: glutamate racemase [Ruminococcaceae bacterium]|nr:glutamate racemase [Oscillospiraceae bacterium]
MDSRPIGVFDSGLGGLTVVRRLLEELPNENIVYFGDTGRVPYGTRSPDTIKRYTAEDCRFLRRHDVKMIIAACGTASSVGAQVLKAQSVPAIGVVDATAKAAALATRSGRIGVIGTAATVQTDAFGIAIRALNPDAQVFSQACPLFVSLVENGWIAEDDEVTIATAKRYLSPLMDAQIDTLIMGCTHFPLLAPILQTILGNAVTLIDSGSAAAGAAKELLASRDMLAERENGSCRFFVSDTPQGFANVAKMFLGREVAADVELIDPALLSE